MSVKTISRSQGRSSTAASAYRSADKICDERTGEIHDYSNRNGVECSEIITPENSPEWSNDRNELWNHAEDCEKRSNSVVAREFEVGIPHELNKAERKNLINDFSHKLSDRHQVAVDYAIHEPHKSGDERNFHAHILVTTRRIDETGFTEKTRELDNRNSGEVKFWREEWANTANKHLEQSGHEKRIDHRSNKDRGIEAEPTIHIGVTAMEIHRRGEYSERYEQNQNIISLNEYRESRRLEESNNESPEIDSNENKEGAVVLQFESSKPEEKELTEIEEIINNYEQKAKDENMEKGQPEFNSSDNSKQINELKEKSEVLKADGENLSWSDQRKLDSLNKEQEGLNREDGETQVVEEDGHDQFKQDDVDKEYGLELEQELPREREKEIQRLRDNAQDHLNESVHQWNTDLKEIKNKEDQSPEDAQQQEMLEGLINQAQESKRLTNESSEEKEGSTDSLDKQATETNNEDQERELEREISLSDEKLAEMAESQEIYEKFVDSMNEQAELESLQNEEPEAALETVDEQGAVEQTEIEQSIQSHEEQVASEKGQEESNEQEHSVEAIDEQETVSESEVEQVETGAMPETVDEQEAVEQTEVEQTIQNYEAQVMVEQGQEKENPIDGVEQQSEELTEIEQSIQNYEAQVALEQGQEKSNEQETVSESEVEQVEPGEMPETVDEQEAVEQTEIEQAIQNYEAQVEADSQESQNEESEQDSGIER